MNFIDALPDSVTVQGREYRVYTDFRDWIKFDRLLRDKDLDDRTRAAIMLDWYADELPPADPEVLNALFVFYLCGEKSKPGEKAKVVFAMEQDASMVYTAFVQSYAINLHTVDYLHWWEFQALLAGLPEDTKLAKIIGYRAVDISKLPKGERSRYRELQRMYAISDKSAPQKMSLEDKNRELIQRAKDARRRAELGKVPQV